MQQTQPYTGDLATRYHIIETESCPMISESRVSVFDVMIDHDDGDSIYDIAMTYNLTPLQVKTAVAYIEANRSRLEPELKEAIQARQALERHYNQIAEKIRKEIAQLPMTPERKAFYALLEKSRRKREELTNAIHSQ